MKKISVVPNIEKDKDLSNTKKVIDLLEKYDKEIVLSEQIANTLGLKKYACDQSALYKGSDLLVVLGGDGTLLNGARHAAPFDVPILGINLGHLGFLVELENDNLEQFFIKLFEGDYTIDHRMMIEGTLSRNSMPLDTFVALNDIGITRGSFSRIITLQVFVDGHFVDDYTADGIIVSTPTGSTAYSLSAGGPIVHPNMNLIMLTPVCPHTLHSRSFIVPEDKVICIHIDGAYNHDSMITVDGQKGYKLQHKDVITVKKAPFVTKLIRINNRNFYDVLRIKLNERGAKDE